MREKVDKVVRAVVHLPGFRSEMQEMRQRGASGDLFRAAGVEEERVCGRDAVRCCFSLFLFGLLATPPAAFACLNDRYTQLSEREFRSSYENRGAAQPTPAPAAAGAAGDRLPYERHWRPEGIAWGVAGLGMIALAVQVTRRREMSSRGAA